MEFTEASDGPRVVLFGSLDADLLSLQRTFRKLRNEIGRLSLETQDYVIPLGGIQIELVSSGVTHGFRKGGIRRQPSGKLQFQWLQTPEEWDCLADFVEGLLESQSAGHQYLTRYPGDDVTVIVSKGEYSARM